MTDVIEVTEHATSAQSQKQLGRIPAFDPRDRKYLAAPPRLSTIDRRSRHWIMPKPLDQLQTPQCVAYGWEHFLLANPIKNKMYKTPQELYNEAQTNDEFPDDVPYDGTSVRGGAKALQLAGYLKNYEWMLNVLDVARQVLAISPVVVGTDWDSDMFEPFQFKGETFIRRGGGNAGGHCYVIKGINLDLKCFCGKAGGVRILNSWGETWAEGGKAWICMSEMDGLIANWGEACAATEMKFKEQTK